MEDALKKFIASCKQTFGKYQSTVSKAISFPGLSDFKGDFKPIFEKAIGEAEKSSEFRGFSETLGAGPLAGDLERLTKREAKIRSRNLTGFKSATLRQAAQAFFRNTGTYLNLWEKGYVDEEELLKILKKYPCELSSDHIRLFVFDGFVLYDKDKLLESVKLPIGEMKKYKEEELKNLLRVPQSYWHGNLNQEVLGKAVIWHILTHSETAEYGGATGLWIKGVLESPFDLNSMNLKRKESDIEIIGPIFLCIGEAANLATEIQVRTNIFEYFPVFVKTRNDYLPWDNYDDEGNANPRTWIRRIGEDGHALIKIFEIWTKINKLDPKGFLRYPTQAYVRSIMNLHSSEENLMEAFVGLVTVLESLLTPGERQELTYKTAIRGAAILSSEPKFRGLLFETLTDFYKMRSQIVHEGHSNDEELMDLYNLTFNNLTGLCRQIFLRYVFLLNLGIQGGLPNWVLPDSSALNSNSKRLKTVSQILDAVVMDPNLTTILEDKMREWGLYENWSQQTTFGLSVKKGQRILEEKE